MLAAWILVAVVIVVTQGWTPSTKSYVPTWLLIAAAIVLVPRLLPEGIPIKGYGAMVFLGAMLGLYLAVRRAGQNGLDADVIYSLAFWMFLAGIVGARAFYVIEYWETRIVAPTWGQTVRNAINFPQGGLVVYGALIGASAAFFCFVRARRLPPLAMADMIAPSLLAGLALGRLGCLLNGCCFGGPSTHPWAISFPDESPPYEAQVANGSMHGFRLTRGGNESAVRVAEASALVEEAGLQQGVAIDRINDTLVDSLDTAAAVIVAAYRGQMPLRMQTVDGRRIELPPAALRARSWPVQPAQVFSAINAGLLGWFLWEFYAFRRRDGEVLAAMLTIYPVTRFVLETIRVDEAAVFSTGLSISQNISVGVLFAAVLLWILLSRRPAGFARLES